MIGITNAVRAASAIFTATVDTTWTGSASPYSQELSVPGLLTTDTPLITLVPSDDYSTAEAQIEAYNRIYRVVAGADTLTVYAINQTTTSVPIQIIAVRK